MMARCAAMRFRRVALRDMKNARAATSYPSNSLNVGSTPARSQASRRLLSHRRPR
jgi:hypothetical protein